MAGLFPEEFKVEAVKLRIAIKRNTSDTARAPKLTGYVLAGKQQLQELLAECEKNGGTVFMRVALWDAKNPDKGYPFEGTIETNHHNPYEKIEPVKSDNGSVWY